MKLLVFIAILTLFACNNNNIDARYLTTYSDWQQQRINQLKAKNGWLNLAGLYWLNEGDNTFGSDTLNNIIFPENKAPLYCGNILFKNNIITLQAAEKVTIFADGIPVKSKILVCDTAKNPTLVTVDSLAFFIIKRGNKYAVRLRDYQSNNINKLTDIPYYAPSENWIIEADYTLLDTAFFISIVKGNGNTEQQKIESKITFTLEGVVYQILPITEGDELFIIIGDKTNGHETYGGGRFMDVPKPLKSGKIALDFNKLYNPPCVFSAFANCPMPPKQNKIQCAINAGEKVPDAFKIH